MRAKYIGPEYEIQGLLLKKNKEYNIEIEHSGPQMIINGQPIITPDSSLIVHIDNVSIPYAPNLMNSHWQLLG